MRVSARNASKRRGATKLRADYSRRKHSPRYGKWGSTRVQGTALDVLWLTPKLTPSAWKLLNASAGTVGVMILAAIAGTMSDMNQDNKLSAADPAEPRKLLGYGLFCGVYWSRKSMRAWQLEGGLQPTKADAECVRTSHCLSREVRRIYNVTRVNVGHHSHPPFEPAEVAGLCGPVGRHPWVNSAGQVDAAKAGTWVANIILMAGGASKTAFACALAVVTDIADNPGKFKHFPSWPPKENATGAHHIEHH